jgi:uncharacterized membrane protein YdjX (TVP38/TMEM64 family)
MIFLRQHWQKIAGALIWATAIGGYTLYAQANALSPLAAVQRLVAVIAGTSYGPLLYIAVYTLRPLLFFPATLLTIAGGFLFGPVLGFVYATLGGNASATVSYFVGRYFGEGMLQAEASGGLLQRYTARLRANSFETVLIMRFLFLPYDLVSYLCGFLRINWRGFALATFLGGIPGGISIVALGASLQGDLTDLTPRLDPLTLAIGIVMFIASLALSRYFRRRESTQTLEATRDLA